MLKLYVNYSYHHKFLKSPLDALFWVLNYEYKTKRYESSLLMYLMFIINFSHEFIEYYGIYTRVFFFTQVK